MPKNSTHLTQPLDVGFFGPIKRQWRQILTEWKLKEGKSFPTLPKDQFPKLMNRLLVSLSPKVTAIASKSFEATGIRPFDEQAVLKRLPNELSHTASPNVSGLMIDFLKELRHTAPKARQKKTKLTTQAGKSVTLEDLNLTSKETPTAGTTKSKQLVEKKQKKTERIKKERQKKENAHKTTCKKIKVESESESDNESFV